MRAVLLALTLALYCNSIFALGLKDPDYKVSRWAPIVKREAQVVFGIKAPVPMLLGQIKQESGGDDKVTAIDLGRGLVQTMDSTAEMLSKWYPELGKPDPYNPTWAVRAQARYMNKLMNSVKGSDDCQKAGAGLKGYNAGPGYVYRAQKKAPHPEVWFGETEYIESGQSSKNFEYSRQYPRKILFSHQKRFIQYGTPTCLPIIYPDK